MYSKNLKVKNIIKFFSMTKEMICLKFIFVAIFILLY